MTTVVEGDQKALFSIATIPRCKGGYYFFACIVPLYPWYVPYNAECKARKHQVLFLKSLVWHDLGLNPDLPDHWQTFYPLGQWADEMRENDTELSMVSMDGAALSQSWWKGFMFTLKHTLGKDMNLLIFTQPWVK